MSTKKVVEIVREKINIEQDKNKNVVLQSIKYFANDSKRVDSAKLTRSQVEDLLKTKERAVFLHKLHKTYKIASQLKVDSEAKKQHLCKNTAYCTSADNLARFLQNDAVKYINKHVDNTTAQKKAVKSTAKK